MEGLTSELEFGFDQSDLNPEGKREFQRPDTETIEAILSEGGSRSCLKYGKLIFPLPLSLEEEKMLIKVWLERGDQKARERFLEAQFIWVEWLARNRAFSNQNGSDNSKIDWEDLFQEGQVPLMKAFEKFDPDQSSFLNWALRPVKGAMSQFILRNKRIVRLNRTPLTENVFFGRSKILEMIKEKGPDETIELRLQGRNTKVRVGKILEIYRAQNTRDISFNAPLKPFNSRSGGLEESYPSATPGPLSWQEREEKKAFVQRKTKEVLKRLDEEGLEKTKEIFVNCFLEKACGGKGKNGEDLGEKYGRTYQAINLNRKSLRNKLQIIFNPRNEELLASIGGKIEKAFLSPEGKELLRNLIDIWAVRRGLTYPERRMVDLFKKKNLTPEENELFCRIVKFSRSNIWIERNKSMVS